MKKIICVLMTLLLISIVRADTNVSIGIITDEDINIWANPNTPGETTYYLDGVNFKNTVNDLYENDMSMKGVYYYLSKIFMKKDYKNDWFIVNPFKLDIYEQRFRWVMDNYFVPRTEVYQMMNELKAENMDLNLRIEALEKILGEENVLKGRLNVAKDYNLTSLTYNGTTYTNVKDGFVSLEPVEQEPELTEDEIYDLTWGMRDEHGCKIAIGYNWCESEKECLKECPADLLIENWKDLCNRGIKKFCVILEQRGYFPETEKYEIEVTEGITISEYV